MKKTGGLSFSGAGAPYIWCDSRVCEKIRLEYRLQGNEHAGTMLLVRNQQLVASGRKFDYREGCCIIILCMQIFKKTYGFLVLD